MSLSHPDVDSGIRQNTATRTRDCVTLLNPGTTTYTITWDTGQESHLTSNRVTNVIGATLVITYTGVVTSGLFAGDTFVQTVTGPAIDITLCTLGLGTVSAIHSVVVLEITSI